MTQYDTNKSSAASIRFTTGGMRKRLTALSNMKLIYHPSNSKMTDMVKEEEPLRINAKSFL